MLRRLPEPLRWLARLVELAAVAAVIYGVADLVFSWNPLAASPFHAHRHLPVFRPLPLLWLGVIAEAVNGWIVTLAYLVLRGGYVTGEGAASGPGPGPGSTPAWRVGWRLGLVAWGFWVVSGTFTTLVWLAVPWTLAAANVAFGLPKCLVIGCAVAWYGRRRLYPWPSGAGAAVFPGGAP